MKVTQRLACATTRTRFLIPTRQRAYSGSFSGTFPLKTPTRLCLSRSHGNTEHNAFGAAVTTTPPRDIVGSPTPGFFQDKQPSEA